MMESELIKKRRKSILKKMHQITEKCISTILTGNWDVFYKSVQEREQCLRLMRLSQKEAPEASKIPLDSEEQKIRFDLNESEKKLFSMVEQEKDKILQEVAALRKSKEVINKFKSSWISSSGEEIDETL